MNTSVNKLLNKAQKLKLCFNLILMKHLIEVVKNLNFNNTDIALLKEYKSRDGFKLLYAKEYKEGLNAEV